MIKRILSLTLCVLMILSSLMTLACGSAGNENTTDTTTVENTEIAAPEKVLEAPKKDFEYKAPLVDVNQFSIYKFLFGNRYVLRFRSRRL